MAARGRSSDPSRAADPEIAARLAASAEEVRAGAGMSRATQAGLMMGGAVLTTAGHPATLKRNKHRHTAHQDE